ncbi:MAG: DUF4139 domain-containing protein [Chloroflexi bacterium]|nr:DUF4139 domain-containing protein [Chloroflexota bacterium]
MRMRILALAAVLLFGGVMMTSGQNSANVSLTVYNTGAALIREGRTLTLETGLNSITLRDVAATIIPASVNVKSLSDPVGATVLEQSYRYDRGDAGALLAGYIGETVEIALSSAERYDGQLLRLDSEKATLRAGPQEIVFIRLDDIRSLQFPSPPADLYAGPTLQLLLNSTSAGPHDFELNYLAGGLNWTADYNVFLSADEAALDLTGLVTLSNGSGRSYQDAALKLVAGDISRIEQEADFAEERAVFAQSADADMGGGAGFEQRDLSEYKLYAIARPVSIANEETKQIEFIRGAGIAADITYVFDSSPVFRGYYSPIDYIEGRGVASADVWSHLEFSTGDENGLGADLPAGRARVYRADADGASLLVGESVIDHSPKGEALSLALGAAFDLTGERIQTDFDFVSRRVARESFEIRLFNRKDETVTIRLPERLYRWRDWQIIESSAPFVKVDAASIEFALAVPPGAEEKLTYTVEYRFPDED